MRLYDRFIATGTTIPPGVVEYIGLDRAQDIWEGTQVLMRGATCFDVQNVADYMHHQAARGSKTVWDAKQDFPSAFPQFPLMWMEYNHYSLGGFGILAAVMDQNGSSDVEVHLWGFLAKNGKVYGPYTNMFFTMDDRGQIVSDLMTDHITDPGTLDNPNEGMSEMYPALLAWSFMNCKNVAIENAPFIGPRQQRRRLERQGIKQVRFKTLVIEPMKQVLKTEGGIEQHGLKKALHICRGHFATYSDDKPLFGKYSGTFWKPAHVRGNDEHGTVYKDYKVKM